MEADDEEARAPAEERAFYLSASKVATAIKMLAILQDPTYRPHTELQAVVSQQPLPPVRDARSVARPKSRLGIVLTAEQQSHPSGNAPIIVAAPPPSTPSPLPPTLGTSLVRPFSDYTPTLASPAWMGTRTASAPINGPLSTIPLSTLPRPVITSLPVPRPPPAATFALSPRQLLPWPDAVQALTQQAVDKTWSCIGTTMGRVNAGRAGEVTSSLQEVVHRAIRLVDPWCPKAKSPAEQVEAAKAREAAGGKLPSRTSTGAKPSPRIPVLPLHKGSPRLGKSQLEGETGTKSPALGQVSATLIYISCESRSLTLRPHPVEPSPRRRPILGLLPRVDTHVCATLHVEVIHRLRAGTSSRAGVGKGHGGAKAGGHGSIARRQRPIVAEVREFAAGLPAVAGYVVARSNSTTGSIRRPPFHFQRPCRRPIDFRFSHSVERHRRRRSRRPILQRRTSSRPTSFQLE